MAKRKEKTGTGSYRGILFLFIAICVLMTVFCYQYYKNLHATIRDESKSYLQEVSRRIGSNINRIITDNFAVLNTMTPVLENEKAESIADIKTTLQEQQSHWSYKSLLLIDEEGKAFDLNGREVFLSADSAMREDLLNKKQAMSTTQVINNQELILFAVPLTGISLDGKNMMALAATYDPASFNQILSMNSFNEQAYSQIVTKSGTVVTRTSSAFAIQSGYNIFTSIQNAKLDEGDSFSKMMEDIKNDRSDQIGFSLDGTHRYMVYTPIEPDEWYLLTFVPVQVVNEKSDVLLQSTLLICGLIALTFAALIAVLMYSFGNHKRKLERIAYVDEVTGGNTIQRFYELAKSHLDSPHSIQYALVFTNFEKFKVLNEQLGQKNCDLILYHFNKFISSTLMTGECMGRLTADNFCILLEYDGEQSLVSRFTKWHGDAEKYVENGVLPWGLPVTEFGIYVVDNQTLPLPQMVDRAKLSLRDTTRSLDSKIRYAFYDDSVRRQMFREKQLEDMMEKALADREFQVYLQPKYRLPEEQVGGAEALVRWESVSEGMIYPNDFIPLFEKNGFIVQLDLWVYEEVCRTIRAWLDEGLTPVKVSVNCSRAHFKDPAFLVPYIRIAEQYKIEKKHVEIELTEGMVLEDVERLTKIIGDIRDAGFGCSMDDFGSGYSSLNLIQNIPVDTLKLDKIFFQANPAEAEKTEAVIGSIVKMAKALSMQTVAEGVEHRDQVAMLKRVGCDYIQGYVFAKPMKIGAFEALAYGKDE